MWIHFFFLFWNLLTRAQKFISSSVYETIVNMIYAYAYVIMCGRTTFTIYRAIYKRNKKEVIDQRQFFAAVASPEREKDPIWISLINYCFLPKEVPSSISYSNYFSSCNRNKINGEEGGRRRKLNSFVGDKKTKAESFIACAHTRIMFLKEIVYKGVIRAMTRTLFTKISR